MNSHHQFMQERREDAERMAADPDVRRSAIDFIIKTAPYRYSYNFSWMGRPIIQFPQDMVAMQELIWQVQPDLIVETGVAHGGSIIFYASLMRMMGVEGKVVGIDIDIRAHNRVAIEAHPMASSIHLIQGSSIDPEIVARMQQYAAPFKRVMVILDSNHTHDHVLAELRAYSSLVKSGSYLVVFDTVVEDMPAGWFPDRPWDVGNNPKTAVHAFLKENDRFEIDQHMDNKLAISVAPNGYLRCVKD